MKKKGYFISWGVNAFEDSCEETFIDPSLDHLFPTDKHDGAMTIVAESVDPEEVSRRLRDYFLNLNSGAKSAEANGK